MLETDAPGTRQSGGKRNRCASSELSQHFKRYAAFICSSLPLSLSLSLLECCVQYKTCKQRSTTPVLSAVVFTVALTSSHSLQPFNLYVWEPALCLGHFTHTPSIAFRHLPPNSARIGYATEGALFTSSQLSTDAVSILRKAWVLIRLSKQHSTQARTCIHKTRPTPVKNKKFRLDSNDFGFICAGVSNVVSYKRKKEKEKSLI